MSAEESEIHTRVPKEIQKKLKILAAERGVAQKWLIVSALESFLGGGSEDSLEAVRKDIFETNRRIKALRSDVEILGELLSFFIYHWIGYTPRLEKAERGALAAEAKERHQKFLSLFAKKLASGELSLAPIFSGNTSDDKAGSKQPFIHENDP